MSSAASYRINCPPFAHQAIDGEVVIVNLLNGFYYSLRGCGAEIWGLVVNGADLGRITAELEHRYQAGPGAIAAELARFLGELEGEGILSQHPAGAGAAMVSAGTSSGAARTPFVPPVLEKFTDMQDLILVDPIHEVDEAGWPSAKNAA